MFLCSITCNLIYISIYGYLLEEEIKEQQRVSERRLSIVSLTASSAY
jgi:hypothetical protein